MKVTNSRYLKQFWFQFSNKIPLLYKCRVFTLTCAHMRVLQSSQASALAHFHRNTMTFCFIDNYLLTIFQEKNCLEIPLLMTY